MLAPRTQDRVWRSKVVRFVPGLSDARDLVLLMYDDEGIGQRLLWVDQYIDADQEVLAAMIEAERIAFCRPKGGSSTGRPKHQLGQRRQVRLALSRSRSLPGHG